MISWILAGLALFASPPAPPVDTIVPPTVSLRGEWSFRTGDDARWAAPALREPGWRKVQVPGSWESVVPGYDGYGWYRREVSLPAGLEQGPLGVQLGTVGDAFEVYWNGVLIGRRGAFPPHFVEGISPALLLVPARALAVRPHGPHVMAVRVYNDYAYGGLMGGGRVGRYDVLVARTPPGDTVIGGLISFFLAIGIYHLVFFFRRRSAPENLSFAVLCALVALYGATYSGAFDARVIPYVNPYRLGLLALLAASPIFLSLVNRLLDLRTTRWGRAMAAVFVAAIPVTAVLPLDRVSRLNDGINVWIFLGLTTMTARALRVRASHTPHVRTLLVGTAAFAAAVTWDLATDYEWVPVARVLPGVPGLFWVGFLVFAIAVGIVTAGKWAQAEVDALTDPLTGLPRRHVFEEGLNREIARLRRSGGKLALVLMDLDHFKRVNDTYGHRAGDEVLARVGRLLRHSVRNIDVPARLGGEEFAVLLTDTGLEGARAFVERFRGSLRELEIATSGGGVRVTVSAGVAAGGEMVDADELLDAADAAMYRAKAEGRDRVVAVRVPREREGCGEACESGR